MSDPRKSHGPISPLDKDSNQGVKGNMRTQEGHEAVKRIRVRLGKMQWCVNHAGQSA